MEYNQLDLVILKTVITNKKYALEFANENKADLFSPEIWTVAHHILSYVRTYKDVPTLRVLTEKLSKPNNQTLIENIKSVWEQLDKTEYNDKEFKHDLLKIRKRFIDNQITKSKEKWNTIDDSTRLLEEINKTIQTVKNVSQSKSYDSKNLKEHLPLFVERFNAKKENPDLEIGLKTKYSYIDFATNGLRPADFVLIAGESGFGKSLFLNNIAIQTWMQDNTVDSETFGPGKDIIYFSLEMPYEDCFTRVISRLSGVPTRRIENCKLSKEDFSKVRKALEFIKKYPYQFKIVDIADACANDLENILIDSGEAFDAIFVDYLGIMETNDKSDDSDWLKQGKISYELRAIARKYQLPLFSAVQLNRKGKGKEGEESIGLNRLARSATIATHATHVIQIESREREESRPDFLYHMIKNRKGPKGKGVLMKHLSCGLLVDKNLDDDRLSPNSAEEYFKDLNDISEEMDKLEL